MADRKITYGVGFNVDKSGLNSIKTAFNEITKIAKTMSMDDFMKVNPDKSMAEARRELIDIKQTAEKVEVALNKAFNQKLGTINLEVFNRELNKGTKTTLNEVYNQFSKLGVSGQNAFRTLAMSTTSVNLQLKNTTSILDKMAETLSNTIKWNLASGAINTMTGSVQQAFGFVKNLDTSLNDIRIVTGKSADQMKIFAETANTAAKSLGQSTRAYTDASLIYYQQGLSDREAQARADVTLKAANVTGQNAQEVSEQLTAIWNGYKVTAQEAELYIDKVAAVAAGTAADLEELATGMSKVASAANAMGIDVDQLNAQLATIVSVTRQAPESVGTALKTIYARMSDLKLGGTDEDGMNLGKVSGQLADIGINILDETGNLRDMGDVIEEVAGKWDTWTNAQQVAVAQVMAGTRQYNNLVALFENWDMYTDALNMSAQAAGTLNQQQAIYMESTAAHLQQLATASEDLYKSLLDTDTINLVTDAFRGLIELTTAWVDNLGGGIEVLKTLGAVGMGVFSKQLSGGITAAIGKATGKSVDFQNRMQMSAALSKTNELLQYGEIDSTTREFLEKRKDILNFSKYYDPKEINAMQQALNALVPDANKVAQLENFSKAYDELIVKIETVAKKAGEIPDSTVDFKNYTEHLHNILTQYKDFSDNLIIDFESSDTSQIDEILQKIGKVRTGLGQLSELDLGLDDEIIAVRNFITQYEQLLQKIQNQDITQIDDNTRRALDQIYNDLINKINDLSKKADIKTAEMANQMVKNITAGFDTTKKEANDLKTYIQKTLTEMMDSIDVKKTQQLFDGLLNIGGSLWQAYEGFSALADILTDETIPATEKANKAFSTFATITVPSLLYAIPTLLNGITTLGTAIDKTATTLSAALKAIGGAALPFLKVIGPIAAVAAVIWGLTAAYDALTISAEEAKEQVKKDHEAYEKEAEKLKELETKLEDVNKQLVELYKINKEDLTITDIQDIANLEAENTLLKAQIELQKQARLERAKTELESGQEAYYEKNSYKLPEFEGKEKTISTTPSFGGNGYIRGRRTTEFTRAKAAFPELFKDIFHFEDLTLEATNDAAKRNMDISSIYSGVVEKIEADETKVSNRIAELNSEIEGYLEEQRIFNERQENNNYTHDLIDTFRLLSLEEPSITKKPKTGLDYLESDLISSPEKNSSRWINNILPNETSSLIGFEIDKYYEKYGVKDSEELIAKILKESGVDIESDFYKLMTDTNRSITERFNLYNETLNPQGVWSPAFALASAKPLFEKEEYDTTKLTNAQRELSNLQYYNEALFTGENSYKSGILEALNNQIEEEQKGITEYYRNNEAALEDLRSFATQQLDHLAILEKEQKGGLTQAQKDYKKDLQESMKTYWTESGQIDTVVADAFKYILGEDNTVYNEIKSKSDKIKKDLEEGFKSDAAKEDYFEKMLGGGQKGAKAYEILKVQADAYGMSVEQLTLLLLEQDKTYDQLMAKAGSVQYEAVESESERAWRQLKNGADIAAKALENLQSKGQLDLDEEEVEAFAQALKDLGDYEQGVSYLDKWNDLTYKPVSEQEEVIEKINNELFKQLGSRKQEIIDQNAIDIAKAGQDWHVAGLAVDDAERYLGTLKETDEGYLKAVANYEEKYRIAQQQQQEYENQIALQKELADLDAQRLNYLIANVNTVQELNRLKEEKIDDGGITDEEYLTVYNRIAEKQRESLGYSKEMIKALVDQKIAAENLEGTEEQRREIESQLLAELQLSTSLDGISIDLSNVNFEGMENSQDLLGSGFRSTIVSVQEALEKALGVEELEQEYLDKLFDPGFWQIIKEKVKNGKSVQEAIIETLKLDPSKVQGLTDNYLEGLKTAKQKILEGSDVTDEEKDAYRNQISSSLGVNTDLIKYYENQGHNLIAIESILKNIQGASNLESILSGYDFSGTELDSSTLTSLLGSGAKTQMANLLGVEVDKMSDAAVAKLSDINWLEKMQKGLGGDINAFWEAYNELLGAQTGNALKVSIDDPYFKIMADQVIEQAEKLETAKKAFEDGTATKEQIELLASQTTSVEKLNKLKAKYVEVGGEASNLDKIAAANKDKLVDSTLEQIGANRELLNLYMQQYGLTEDQALIKLGFDVNKDDFKNSVSSAYESIKDVDFGSIATQTIDIKNPDGISSSEKIISGYDSDQLLAVYNLMESLEQITGKEFAEGSLLDGETMQLFQEGMKGSAESMQEFINKIIALLNLAGTPEAEILKQLLTGLSTEGHTVTMDQTVADAGEQLSNLKDMQDAKKGTKEWSQGIDALYESFENLKGAKEIIKDLENGTIDLGTATDNLVDLVLKEIGTVTDLEDEQWKLYKTFLKNNDVTVEGYKDLKEYTEQVEVARDKIDEFDFENFKMPNLDDSMSDLQKEIEVWKSVVQDDQAIEMAFGVTPEMMGENYDDFKQLLLNIVNDYYEYAQECFDNNEQPINMQTYIRASVDSSYAEQAIANGDARVANAMNRINGKDYHAIVDALIEANVDFKFNMPTLTGIFAAIGNLILEGFGNLTGNELGNQQQQNTGGGGGGGEEEPYEKKQKDPIEDRPDVYHDINIEIEKLTRSFEKLADSQEKLMGKKLIDNLNEQLKVIEKQKTALEEKRVIAEGEAERLRKELSQITVGSGTLALQFDETTGQVTNYEEVIRKQIAAINKRIKKYNDTGTEEGQAELEKEIEEEEKKLEKLKKLLEEYETTINETIPDIDDKLNELMNQQIELKIEKFKLSVEVELELGEAKREWQDFERRIIKGLDDEDLFGNAVSNLAKIESYFNNNGSIGLQFDENGQLSESYLSNLGAGTGELASLTTQINNTMREINQMKQFGWSEIYGDNMSQAMEDLKDYTDKLQEGLLDIKDLEKEIKEAYYDTIDQVKEDFDEQIAGYEYISDLINHDMEVIKLLYGEDDYNSLATLYGQQHQNNLDNLEALKAQADFWKTQMESVSDKNSEEWKMFKENYTEAMTEFNSALETSLDNIINKYANAINQIFDTMKKDLSGGLGFDYMNKEWDLINRNADQYLDTINKAYAIQDLENKYNKAIDNASSVKAQKALNALKEAEVDSLENIAKLSQYEVERAEKLLDIELKRIALEEAQENKSKMRLRRDSQGNYTYQYIADEDAIAKAREDLAAAQNDLYNFDKNRLKENLDQARSVIEEYFEEIAAIYLDTTLTEEEKTARLQMLEDQYKPLIEGIIADNALVTENLGESIESVYGAVEDIGQLVPFVTSGIQEMINKIGEEGGFAKLTEDLFTDLNTAFDQFNSDLGAVNEYLNTNNSSAQDFAQSFITATDQLVGAANSQITAIQGIIDIVKQLAESYKEAADNAIKAAQAGQNLWTQNQQQNSQEYQTSSSSTGTTVNRLTSKEVQIRLGEENEDGTRGWSVISTKDGRILATGIANNATKEKNSGTIDPTADTTTRVEGADGDTITDERILSWWKNAKRFKTGGYTGEWGAEGRLAVLDQKELVLNQADTANILKAVDFMRHITDSLNNSVESRMFSLMNQIASAANGVQYAPNSDTLEQQVHIEANFPSVTNSAEIESAFNNLVNIAAQRAMENRR